jgi:hypothetical protein
MKPKEAVGLAAVILGAIAWFRDLPVKVSDWKLPDWVGLASVVLGVVSLA